MNKLIRIWSFCALFCFISLYGIEGGYEFTGHHLMASYLECNHAALTDLENLEKTMHLAAKASGATILSSSKHVFPPHGLTMVILLSESHASIHTYPEHGACFVDFFTCGHSCDASKFDEVLTRFLQPKQASRQLFHRNSDAKQEFY